MIRGLELAIKIYYTKIQIVVYDASILKKVGKHRWNISLLEQFQT